MWPKKKQPKRPLPLAPDPRDDPSSLGNLIVQEGILTPEQFAVFLSDFQSARIDMLLGQFIRSKKKANGEPYMTDHELEVLLLKQERMRNGGRVGHEAVLKMMDVAQRSQDELSSEVSEFNAAMLKANGEKA